MSEILAVETSGKKSSSGGGSGGGGSAAAGAPATAATTTVVVPSTPTAEGGAGAGTAPAAGTPANAGVHCFEIRTANVDYYVGEFNSADTFFGFIHIETLLKHTVY